MDSAERGGRAATTSLATRVQGVKGVHSNGRTVEEARRRVRDALSLAVDDAATAELRDHVVLPTAVRKAIKDQQTARREADRAQRAATRAQRRAAQLLLEGLGLSTRDAGELLGVSHQMVRKLQAN